MTLLKRPGPQPAAKLPAQLLAGRAARIVTADLRRP